MRVAVYATRSGFILGLPALLLPLWAACSSSPLARESITDPGQLLFNGYVRPELDCYKCHGGDAEGGKRGPDLAGLDRYKSPERIRHSIRTGRGSMPSFRRNVLSDEEMAEIIHWLATL